MLFALSKLLRLMLWLCLQENPAAVLGELRAIKAKYAKLFLEMEQIAAAQKQSMNSVRMSMNAITELTQHLQHTRDLEVPSPTVYTLFNLMLYWCSDVRKVAKVFNTNCQGIMKKMVLMKINSIIHILLFWRAMSFLSDVSLKSSAIYKSKFSGSKCDGQSLSRKPPA